MEFDVGAIVDEVMTAKPLLITEMLQRLADPRH
jgi:hypothetical protein